MSFEIDYINRRSFIEGQLKLYKLEFIETGNDSYLKVMNELNETSKFLEKCRDIMIIVHKKNKYLNIENEKLNNILK